MSFLKSSTSFTRYRVVDEVPASLWTELPDKLRQFAMKDIDELPEQKGWGWVSFEDMLDVEWAENPPQKGAEYMTFALRVDTRRVPPAVVKKHLAQAIKAEELKVKAAGKSFVSRERKKEIKEQVMFVLNKRFLPIPAEFQVIWNVNAGLVYIASVQPKLLELFEEFFVHSFGLHLEQLTPYGLAVRFLPEAELDRLDEIEPTSFRM